VGWQKQVEAVVVEKLEVDPENIQLVAAAAAEVGLIVDYTQHMSRRLQLVLFVLVVAVLLLLLKAHIA